ncbi:MAG: dolichyl-phosphate beta-D-mannosyltransferase [Candidatus Marinimicrobia bacterium]|nr:dolichyl-phosphate beta-D-mannosyltransferase [Candidatus Neomarinimicrobiota bacterium]
MKILIITPTFNESKNIILLIEKILKKNPNYHLLVIDDNSPDGTAQIVKKMQDDYKNIFIEEREKKSGLGTAYIHGFNWALKNDYDYIVQIDADLSHNPDDIPRLINRLENNDLVIGSRYTSGVSVVNWPIRRLLLSYFANLYARLITGMHVKDATGGFKAWKREVLESIELDHVQSQGYSFQIEMNFRALSKGFKVTEEPIIFIDRTIGESKMSGAIMNEAIWMVWLLRIKKILGFI